MITAVVPMAGRGARFQEAGYHLPKYMVEVGGRSLFEHAVTSLPLEVVDRLVFVVRQEHRAHHGLDGFLSDRMAAIRADSGVDPEIDVVALEHETRGQAETVLEAAPHIEPEGDLIIYNIDTRFHSSSLPMVLTDPERKVDGVLGSFTVDGEDDKWSFAAVDPHGQVSETAEKRQISNVALTGLYHFSRAEDFLAVAKEAIGQGKTTRGEFYVAPLYNHLIARGRRFVVDAVDSFTPLGTPEDVAALGSIL